MKSHVETLRVVWKFIRRTGYPSTRTPKTYCSYIIENEKHKHRQIAHEGSELFELLSNTRIYKDIDSFTRKNVESIFVEGIYNNDKLVCIQNPKIMN